MVIIQIKLDFKDSIMRFSGSLLRDEKPHHHEIDIGESLLKILQETVAKYNDIPTAKSEVKNG